MALFAELIDPDVFTIAGVFSAAECTALIERAESIGFGAASVHTLVSSSSENECAGYSSMATSRRTVIRATPRRD